MVMIALLGSTPIQRLIFAVICTFSFAINYVIKIAIFFSLI